MSAALSATESLRRRAASAALAPVLDESALIDALWMQHDDMRGDAVSDIIAYIDAVAARHLLDAATRTRLYEALYRALRQDADSLPMDPWPLMQAVRPTAARPSMATMLTSARVAPRAAPATAAVLPSPATVPPVAAPVPVAAVDAPAPPPLAPLVPTRAAHEVVFSALVQAMMQAVAQFHAGAVSDLRSNNVARLDRAKVSADVRQQARAALNSPANGAWSSISAAPEQLAALVHELYVGLCETLGPVDADQVLMHAVRQAEQTVQAREYPPSRFL